jgi:hypothetical protein
MVVTFSSLLRGAITKLTRAVRSWLRFARELGNTLVKYGATKQYLDLVRTILDTGGWSDNRISKSY